MTIPYSPSLTSPLRLFFDVAIERTRIAFARMKLLLVLLFVALGVVIIYQLILHNWAAVQTLFQDATAVGIIGTLLGAVIGGFFSLVGSISVNKYQIRAQTQIRRKNLIYTPLYDELVEIHNIILKCNPYPDYITFRKQQQTIIAHPQFVVWKTIKSDSRYLESPKKLERVMEKLESNVMAYLEIRDNVGKILTTILNDVLKLPTVKSLQAEYAQLLSEKKAMYADYQKAREDMRALQTAKANVDRILGDNSLTAERESEKDGR